MDTVRTAYTGSCHCGSIKYIAAITLPKHADIVFDKRTPKTISRIYKCNCTPCHKMQMFHVRLVDAPQDFILLNPSGDTAPLDHIVIGKGEVADVDVEEFGGVEPSSGKTERVWRLKKEGYDEGNRSYFSLNASTLDHDQAGLDLRQWHERGWIRYLDEWRDELGWELHPAPGGMY